MQTQQVVATEQSKREYILKVIGLGVTLDKYRQDKLWGAAKRQPFHHNPRTGQRTISEYRLYGELMEAVPHPRREKILHTPAQVSADPTRPEHGDGIKRQPLVGEWLEATAYAQRSDIRGTPAVDPANYQQ